METILHAVNFFTYGGTAKLCHDLAKASLGKYRHVFLGCVDGPMKHQFKKLGDTIIADKRDMVGPLDYSSQYIENIIQEYHPSIIHVWLPGQENPHYFQLGCFFINHIL